MSFSLLLPLMFITYLKQHVLPDRFHFHVSATNIHLAEGRK